MNLFLETAAPFSLPAVIRSHGWCQMPPFAVVEGDKSLRYIDRLSNGLVLEYVISSVQHGVQIDVSQEVDETASSEILNRIHWMLSLDVQLDGFYSIARREPKLAHVVERSAGRILRSPSLFEDAIKTILTTNTIWSKTVQMASTLVSSYGDELGDSGRRAFPTPERLAELSEDELRSTPRVGYRAPYILELSRRVASGDLKLEALKSSALPTAELRKVLLAIKGIGPYAAANLLMILGRFDFLPVDSWALKIVSQEFHNGSPITPKDVEGAFAQWGEYKGLVYWFWGYQT